MAGHYRGTCNKDDPPCYLFIRYGRALHQTCKNSLMKQLSIHSNYTGNIVGIAEEVEVLEGGACQSQRASDKGVVIMRFECQCEAERWLHSTPEIKQQDWLDGVDVAMVNAKKPIDLCKPWLQILDIDFIDYDRFLNDYVLRAVPFLDKVEGNFGVVASDKPRAMRGLWNPGHLIMNQFDSKEQFLAAFDSDEYKPLKELRQRTSRSNIMFFKLQPFK